jgi:hypothetical protein
MSLTIEKVANGYIVSHHDTRQIATAEHVANFIRQFWPDVADSIIRKSEPESAPRMDDDLIQNG